MSGEERGKEREGKGRVEKDNHFFPLTICVAIIVLVLGNHKKNNKQLTRARRERRWSEEEEKEQTKLGLLFIQPLHM
jgi:hypothetical protein